MMNVLLSGDRRVAAAALMLGALSSVGAASAQPEAPPCLPIPCTPVDVGPFAPPAGWTFVPDRRPVAILPLSNGSRDLSDSSLVHWWYTEGINQDDGSPYGVGFNGVPDAFDELLERMEDLYAIGFRRIHIRMPAGNIEEESGLMDSSQWWAMPEWKRLGFQTAVAAWIKAKRLQGDPVDLGIYSGYQLADPCTAGMDDAHMPNFADPIDACVMFQNVKPWMEVGVKEYWFDNGSIDWRQMMSLQHSTNYSARGSEWRARIKFGGEAVPATTGNCASSAATVKIPQPEALAGGAWLATYRFARTRYTHNSAFRSFDPATSEVGLMLSDHRTTAQCGPFPHNSPAEKLWDFEDALQFYKNGWVLWPYAGNPELALSNSPGDRDYYEYDYEMPRGRGLEATFRIYDFGPVAALADFNSDGRLDTALDGADFLAFVQTWINNVHTHAADPTYVMGDINDDDTVDYRDLADFADACNLWNVSRIVRGIDLGEPTWIP